MSGYFTEDVRDEFVNFSCFLRCGKPSVDRHQDGVCNIVLRSLCRQIVVQRYPSGNDCGVRSDSQTISSRYGRHRGPVISKHLAIVPAFSESRYLVVPAKRICTQNSNIDIIIMLRPPVLSNPIDGYPINVFRGVRIDVDTPDTGTRRTGYNRMRDGDSGVPGVDTSGEFPMEEVERLVFDADPYASPGKAAFVCVTRRDGAQGRLSLFTRVDLECRQASERSRLRSRSRSRSRRNVRASPATSREHQYQTSDCNLPARRKDGFPRSHLTSSSWSRGETATTEPMTRSTGPRQGCRASEHIPQKVLMFPLKRWAPTGAMAAVLACPWGRRFCPASCQQSHHRQSQA